MATLPLIVAEIVLVWATVELSRPALNTPLAFVVPVVPVAALPVPVAAQVTPAPLMGLLKASRTVIVMIDCVPPTVQLAAHAVIGLVVAMVEFVPLGAPGVAVAVKVTGLPVSPAEVACRVLAPATVPSVQLVTVAMPLA